MPAKMISEIPLPIPRSVICSPSHLTKDDRAVARVLRDLPAPHLPFLRELLEVGPDDRQELQDDRRRDVRRDAEREDRQAPQGAAREHVEEAEQASGARLEELLEGGRVQPGRRDVRTDPVDREQPEREEHTLPQVRDREDVAERLEDLHYRATTSQRPPAASIFFFAPSVKWCAETTSAFLSSPEPRTFTPWLVFLTPAFLRASRVTASPALNMRSRASTLTVDHSLRKIFVNPRFGMRR